LNSFCKKEAIYNENKKNLQFESGIWCKEEEQKMKKKKTIQKEKRENRGKHPKLKENSLAKSKKLNNC
jgi:hypothetical protein